MSAPRGPRGHQFCHLQGLGVVRDHALDERHVGSGGLWGLQLRRLVLGEDTVRPPGEASCTTRGASASVSAVQPAASKRTTARTSRQMNLMELQSPPKPAKGTDGSPIDR